MEEMTYDEVQELFMRNLPTDERFYNEYHALLVHLAKWVCKKAPQCGICVLKNIRRKVKITFFA